MNHIYGEYMAEYWFKLMGDWDYGAETVKFDRGIFSSDKQARSYAIKFTNKYESKIPNGAYVKIEKVIGSKIKYVGDVTSFRPTRSRRTFRFISNDLLNKGILDGRILNLDGSFKYAKKKSKKISAPFGL